VLDDVQPLEYCGVAHQAKPRFRISSGAWHSGVPVLPGSAVRCRTAASAQQRRSGMPTPPTPAGLAAPKSSAHFRCQARPD